MTPARYKSPFEIVTEKHQMNRLRNAVIACALLLASCLVVFGLTEATVRLFFPVTMQPRFVRDSGFGIRDNQPNVRTRHYDPRDYEVRISTNSDGLRGTREYGRSPASGTRRIAFLGDSFVFGYGCNDNQVVSAVLENLLNGATTGTGRWEVPNFGVSGYGQAEELVLYRNKVRRYKPDASVLFYFDNDIGNNAVAGIFALGKDGEVEPTGKSFLPGIAVQEWMLYKIPMLQWLFEHSQAWNLVRNRLSSLVQRRMLKKVNLKYHTDTTPEARSLTRALLLELASEVKQDGSRFIVVVIPMPDLSSNFPFSRGELQATGMTVLDGRNFLSKEDYYPHDGHWKPSGHRKAAEVLRSLFTSGEYFNNARTAMRKQ